MFSASGSRIQKGFLSLSPPGESAIFLWARKRANLKERWNTEDWCGVCANHYGKG